MRTLLLLTTACTGPSLQHITQETYTEEKRVDPETGWSKTFHYQVEYEAGVPPLPTKD